MEIKVKSLFLKISPRKFAPNLYSVRGQNAEKSLVALSFTNTKGAKLAAGLLKSALAIAKENDLDSEKLYIKSIFCTEGPRLKRRQIKARGRSDAIINRMSHLNLVISDKPEEKKNNIEETKIINKEKKSKSKITNSK